MRLIDADELKKVLSDKDYITYTHEFGDAIPVDWIMSAIDNAPTIETGYDLYREETCERKTHCYDYKYWHCIGCHGCKADVGEEANEDRPIVEKVVTKGGMTLALRKPDREISDFANVIANMLGDITVRELKDKFNTITFTDTNTGCIVKYCRVDAEEADNE